MLYTACPKSTMKISLAPLLSAALLQYACSFSTTKTGAELIRLRQDSANNVLCNLLKDDDATKHQSLVLLEGLVSKRRAIGKHLIFLDIVPLDLPNIETHTNKKKSAYDDIESIAPVQAIMRRDFWTNTMEGTNMTSYDVYHKIIQPGVHVKMTGHAGPSRNNKEAILFCHSAKYALANDNPQHLRNVLRYAKEGALDTDEVIEALPCIDQEELANMIGIGDPEITTNYTFGEMATIILRRFPKKFLSNPSQLMGSTNSQKVKLLPPSPPEYVKAPFFIVQDDAGEAVSIAHIIQEQKHVKNADTLMDSNAYKQFTISGWVQNRRRYQGCISVLELVDEFSSVASISFEADGDFDNAEEDASERDMTAENSKLKKLWKRRVYAVVHPDALHASNDSDGTIPKPASNGTEISETYGNILCSGARVMLQGHLQLGSLEETPTFWVTSCRLMRSSWRLSAVRQVLDLLHEGKFAVDEAADALKLSGGYSQAEDIANGTTSTTERQWMAAELTRQLQGANSRVGKISSSMTESLSTYADARDQYPLEKIDFEPELDSTQAVTSLLENNVSREGSRWQRQKKPQLKCMIDQIETVLRSHPEFGLRKLKVYDIGGGRGLLSNLLAETFGSDTVEVQVVDISRSAVNNGMMRAKRRGLQNIQYAALDATTLDVTGGVDVVVALHACGTLSDVALGHAVCQGAGFVICPCCFLSNPHLRVSKPVDEDHRPAELVTAEEWLEVEPAQYGPLKQLAEVQGDINMATTAMHTICGLRAIAVERQWKSSRWPTAELNTSIKMFPIGFSTRNLCLVGEFNNK